MHTQPTETSEQVPTSELKKLTITEALDQPGIRVVRERFSNKRVIDYLESLSDQWRDLYLKLHRDHSHNIHYDRVCAGAKHHHWWLGGMADHVKEMIGYALDLYSLYPGDLSHKVTRDDIIIACYLHDFAKVWGYEEITDEDREKDPKKYLEQQLFKSSNWAFKLIDQESKTLLELARFGIVPTERQWSAVLFAEGGYADANFTIGGLTRTSETVMSSNPLAVITHMADMYSSQILGGSLVNG